MGENLVALETDGCRVNAEVTPVWNARSPVEDRFEERSVTFEEEETPGRRISLIVRAYDDGVGFRYGILSDRSIDNSKAPRPGGSIITVSVRQYTPVGGARR